jgi:hypothetical protein
MPPRALGYKKSSPSPLRVSTVTHRSAIAAAAGELPSPLAPVASQTLLALP